MEATMKDRDYVNFPEEHELNHHLRQIEKRQTVSNRTVLQAMGKELKVQLGKTRLLHIDFRPYIKDNSNRLE